VTPNRSEAGDLAAGVIADYRALDPVSDMAAARVGGRAQVHEYLGDNSYHERTIVSGDIGGAKQAADIAIKCEYRTSRQIGCPDGVPRSARVSRSSAGRNGGLRLDPDVSYHTCCIG
jgi:CO/xanthine dehydrogenase Mo-binding subunit